ncbi:MAG TPA: hypothetical protein VHS34_10175 [Terriglobales bacterium]|jgi:hypothetical protein|nr:hypothetical protein [Terriglobales bacterium]
MRQSHCILGCLLTAAAVFLLMAMPVQAQELAKRLILKDGSYQLATKWEVKGERVRYLSAERNEWEEVPNSLVDWAATDKYEKDRAAGKPAPEAVALDKELEAERQADEARSPHVAPGLRLPDDGGIILLDTYQSQPQLVELLQSSGELNRNIKGNILRSAVNPIASSKQIIEVPGLHAKIQAHATLPAIYVNVEQQDQLDNATQIAEKKQQENLPWDRFRIVRLQANKDKRVVGDIKIAVYGKVSQEQKFVPTTAAKLTGGWVKVTPSSDLEPGEYAVVELLGKEGMNLYVWDFGVNPSAAANPTAWKPDASAANPLPDKPRELQKR